MASVAAPAVDRLPPSPPAARTDSLPPAAAGPAPPSLPPAVTVAGRQLRACTYQVAGHLFENGKAGSLVDGEGRFYKPLQAGPRGARELAFYTHIASLLAADGLAWPAAAAAARAGGAAAFPPSSWAAANAPLLAVLPVLHGTHTAPDGRLLLVLEDVAGGRRRPAVVDIKIGRTTAAPHADAAAAARCAAKDAATTQAELGYRVCGAQSYRAPPAAYRRLDKAAAKRVSAHTVRRELGAWAANGGAATPATVFGGAAGAAAQLRALAAWFASQTAFAFYSASVLIVYEGAAGLEGEEEGEGGDGPAPAARLCDFAHTYCPCPPALDSNFAAGLTSLIAALDAVAAGDAVADALG